MSMQPLVFLRALFDAAVAAADPRQMLADYLPEDRTRPVIVVGAGKAAASMAAALEAAWSGPIQGLVVTRYGHGLPCRFIEVIEASHPVPDELGQQAAQRMLQAVAKLTPRHLVICLISGGGSALLSLPAPGISLKEKQEINRALLRSGATIAEMNCVRKHLSAIKGGRLAAACAPAELLTLAISDVPGDDPAVIASGPTVADPTTSQDALHVLTRYAIDMPPAVRSWLMSGASETLKPGDPRLANTSLRMIATPYQSLQAAAYLARKQGITPLVLSDEIEGEARDVALVHAALARFIKHRGEPINAPCVILSGGETTVSVRGSGRGGRNAEFLLALANALRGESGITALAGDTDGIDGSEDNAGACYTPESWRLAEKKGLRAQAFLDNNDGYGFFHALDSLIVTGPTRTNVNDFRAILVTTGATDKSISD